MQEIVATRITHRGKPAIRVVGVTHRHAGILSDGVAIIDGERADVCDWVIVRQHSDVALSSDGMPMIDEDGCYVMTPVPGSAEVFGLSFSEVTGRMEARSLRGGVLIRVQDQEDGHA